MQKCVENTAELKQQRRLLQSRGICTVIPTYNNEGTIEEVVERTLLQCADVIVVNDGCTDSTPDLLAQLADIYDGQLHVVTLNRNKGKGSALKAGFREARKLGFAYAITLDADGQHYPEDIQLMLKANQQNPGALIVGERQHLEEAERSGGSKFANSFSNFWFCVQTGRRLNDTQTGYRLYPLRKLHFMWLLTSRYEAEVELLVFSAWNGVKLVSTPVNVFYPPKEERVSHFRPVLDFTRISILNTILCVLAICYGYPRTLLRQLMRIARTLWSMLVFAVISLFVLTPIAVLYLNIGKRTQAKKDGLHRLLHAMAVFITKYHGIPGAKYTFENAVNEQFTEPAIIICNHQSHLDLMLMLSLSPKIILLTNDWVWNSKFYGYVIRNAEYYPVSAGIENILPKLKDLVERGYSIAVYPEGTRSEDCSIGRFHQGAFYIAQQLGLDILPLVEYGAGHVLPKKKILMNKGIIRLEVDKRIKPEEYNQQGELRKIASWFRKYYRQRYAEISNTLEQNI